MGCCHGYAIDEAGENAFSVDVNALTFGPGSIGEVAAHVGEARRVAIFTDARVAKLECVAIARKALAARDVVVYDATTIEPTSESFLEAARFARDGRFEAYVSIGGGSVIDTCKAAALYATYPAELDVYVNAPIGQGAAVPGPLPPHVACPTTCGTGSECTGIAVFDHVARGVKTGIASRHLRPSRALVDPTATHTLPSSVVAASGFDVLCHALESYTARPFTARPRGGARPMSQGRNPWSDLGALEALEIGGKYIVRAVTDPSDTEAREELAWAATLAGIAFGNAGVHLPHAMSYSVAGRVHTTAEPYRCDGYPSDHPMVPHGFSVVVNAPSVFRAIRGTSPERHAEAARALGGETVEAALVELMKRTGVPNGVGGVGYGPGDLDALAEGALAQKRLVDNAPRAIDRDAMRSLFEGALRYW
ncbi:MAG: hydroxyacid-oxoacid transhydrogenase [Labilithrix sp.]